MKRNNLEVEIELFKKRWKIVNDRDRKVLRATPVQDKFRQLADLMAWAKDFGWEKALSEEEAEVRERWKKLFKIYGV